MRSSRYVSTCWILLLVACGGIRPTPQRYEYRQIHMGVEARIVLYASDSARAPTAARAAFRRIAELDAIMSDYRDDSELMRLVAQPAGTAIPVSDPLWRVLQVAQDLARRSSGAFDVTSGPLVRLWRETRRSGTLPPADSLRAARERSGWQYLHLEPAAQAVTLEVPGMHLDLGGIAKGFAADEALAVLREHDVRRALIEFGGDIVAGDPPPGRSGWEVRLSDAAGAPPVIELSNRAISTSGDAAQFVDIGGVRYSHVIDPRSGVALRDRTVATVIAPSGLLADALSTLFGVLGPAEAQRFIQRHYPEVTAYIRRLQPPIP